MRILGLGHFMLRLVVSHFELFTYYFCSPSTVLDLALQRRNRSQKLSDSQVLLLSIMKQNAKLFMFKCFKF